MAIEEQKDATTRLESLKNNLQSLQSVVQGWQAIRLAPHTLLRAPISRMQSPPSMAEEMGKLKDISDQILSAPMQTALNTARESEKSDTSQIFTSDRHASRKQRRPPSPESPQPYIAPEEQKRSLFRNSEESPPLLATELKDFIREFNRTHTASVVHIWRAVRKESEDDALTENPIILRLCIQDVLTAYIVLGYSLQRPELFVETISAFGPRERKSPYSQSDYLIYQNLSQQMTKVLQMEPNASVKGIMDMLAAYEGLFIDKCKGCQRVLSSEGHVPTVVRVWRDRGEWDPRHLGCRHT